MVRTVDEIVALSVGSDPSRRVRDLVVDYRRLRVAALKVQRRGLLARTELLPFEAVAAFEQQTIRLADRPAAGEAVDLRDGQRFGSLLGKEVYTERRRHLGRIQTFKVDSEDGNVTVLWVKTPLVLRDMWRQTLIVARGQVVEVTPEAVVVDEAVVKAALKPATTAQFAQQDADALGAV
ncbi:MAG: hypothetical protein U0514_00975 [Candidatus Andersenbacteria bacterium]